MRANLGWVALAVVPGLVVLGTSCAAPESDQQVQVSVTVTGGEFGSVVSDSPQLACQDACSLKVKVHSTLELRPVATSTGVFQGWGGDCPGGTGVCRLEVTKDTAVVATFAPRPVPLHVEVAGVAGGKVRMPDGSVCSGQCDTTVLAGEQVHLAAEPRQDLYLVSWEGACSGTSLGCDLQGADGLSVTARFGQRMRLTVSGVTNKMKATVDSSPEGIHCSPDCIGWFLPGEVVTLTATPTDGLWRFTGWSVPDCTTAVCTVTMDGHKTIEARFENAHVWSRIFGYPFQSTVKAADNGGWYVALVSATAQDFGNGLLPIVAGSYDSLFAGRYSSTGVPLVSHVFGGPHITLQFGMRARTGGGESLGILAKPSGAFSDQTLDLGVGTVVVPATPGGKVKAFIDLADTGVAVAAGELDPASTVPDGLTADLVESGSSAVVLSGQPSPGTLTGVNADWSVAWTLTNPGEKVLKVFAAAPGEFWATTIEVTPDMSCAGGPVPGGALLHIAADGTCKVVWSFPATVVAYLSSAPGGAPFLEVTYSSPFEFAGQQLPEPPSGATRRVRLRFDADGNPRWSRLAITGDTGGQTIHDAVRLQTGELLLTGNYSGISDLSPDAPAPAASYLAKYSDETGELLWSYTFAPPPADYGGQEASFDHLLMLSDGRVAVWGNVVGSFDFGGGLLQAPGFPNNLFVAVYDL